MLSDDLPRINVYAYNATIGQAMEELRRLLPPKTFVVDYRAEKTSPSPFSKIKLVVFHFLHVPQIVPPHMREIPTRLHLLSSYAPLLE